MPEARKRPCRICRQWFRPNPRIGDRQHACGKPECQRSRRQKTQASWRRRNPDYATAWRIQQRAAQSNPEPEPLRLPAPLNQLPWDIAKDQFGAQGADFIGAMGGLLLRTTKDQFRAYVADSTTLAGTLPRLPKKTRAGFGHTEAESANDATGVSPTGPALATSAGSRTAPAAPVDGFAGR
jgi:hypothetical protein